NVFAFLVDLTRVGPHIRGIAPSGSVLPPVDHLRVTFNEPMDPSTFTTDRITSFTGPGGTIDVAGVAPVSGTNNTQFDVTFATQGTTGHYVMTIAAGIE